MGKLPVPKTRAGWIAAVLLAIIFFWIYYLGGVFDNLFIYYNSRLYTKKELKPINVQNDGEINLILGVRKPLAVTNFYPRLLFVDITNQGRTALQKATLWVEVTETGNEERERQGCTSTNSEECLEDTSTFIRLPSLFDGQISRSKVVLNSIMPHETVSARIPIVVDGNRNKEEYHITIWMSILSEEPQSESTSAEKATPGFTSDKRAETNGGKGQNPKSQLPMEYQHLLLKYDPRKAMEHAFVENLLLPPWSNGLLSFLALFLAYLFEHDTSESWQNLPLPRKMRSRINDKGESPSVGYIVTSGLIIAAGLWSIIAVLLWTKWILWGAIIFIPPVAYIIYCVLNKKTALASTMKRVALPVAVVAVVVTVRVGEKLASVNASPYSSSCSGAVVIGALWLCEAYLLVRRWPMPLKKDRTYAVEVRFDI